VIVRDDDTDVDHPSIAPESPRRLPLAAWRRNLMGRARKAYNFRHTS
jgi:hypothetical protein